MAQDILIKQTEDGGCLDVQIGEQDLETVDGLETTVAVLLFTDARAAPEEVNDPAKRRGWIGNILRETELGGMLWLIAQQRNVQEIRNKIADWAQNALQPLIDSNLASEIVVTTLQTETRRMVLNVQIDIKRGQTQKFEFWLDTDLRNLTNGS